MAMIVNCGPGETLQSVYFNVYFSIANVQLPVVDLPPMFITYGLTTGGSTYPSTIPQQHTIDIARWENSGVPLGNPLPGKGGLPVSAALGFWNAVTIYVRGDTVQDGDFIYECVKDPNKNHQPTKGGEEASDGWWTNICQPPQLANLLFAKHGFGYLLEPVPTSLDGVEWWAGLGHSLFFDVVPPGDQVQLYNVFFRANYSAGKQVDLGAVDSKIVRTGSQGQILNPGVNAQIQCWHTNGVAVTPAIRFASFLPLPQQFNTGSRVGEIFSATVFASGGTPPYTYGIIAGQLPPGLSLDPLTGIISGTLGAAGDFQFTVQATDVNGQTATVSCGIGSGCSGGDGGVISNSAY